MTHEQNNPAPELTLAPEQVRMLADMSEFTVGALLRQGDHAEGQIDIALSTGLNYAQGLEHQGQDPTAPKIAVLAVAGGATPNLRSRESIFGELIKISDMAPEHVSALGQFDSNIRAIRNNTGLDQRIIGALADNLTGVLSFIDNEEKAGKDSSRLRLAVMSYAAGICPDLDMRHKILADIQTKFAPKTAE